MIKNRLGKSSILVSPLTLGCMSLGTEEKDATQMIQHALEAGINHLDTADLYNFGVNEEIVGEAIKENRKEIVLTTKVGNHFSKEKNNWFWDPSKAYIISAVEKSLKRLQTDYIDIYLLHGGTIEDPIDETIEAFERLKESGKIRAYGISSIRPNVIAEYVKRSRIDVVMMQYNILDQRPEELLNMLGEHDISVLARGPLAKGMLGNDAIAQIRSKGKDGYLEYSNKELMKTIYSLLDTNQPIEKLAFQYVLQHPVIASAVFGSSSLKQLKESLHYVNVPPLDNHMKQLINSVTKKSIYTEHRMQ